MVGVSQFPPAGHSGRGSRPEPPLALAESSLPRRGFVRSAYTGYGAVYASTRYLRYPSTPVCTEKQQLATWARAARASLIAALRHDEEDRDLRCARARCGTPNGFLETLRGG